MMHRAELQHGLRDLLPSEAVRFGHKLTRLSEDSSGITVEFANGKQECFDLVIGADGIHSVTQRSVAEAITPAPEGVMAYRGLIPAQRVQGEIDTQRTQGWMGPDRSFLIYPVSRGESLNVVAFVPSTLTGEDSWSAPGDIGKLAAEFDGWDKPVLKVIDAMDHTFRWGIYDRPQPCRWSTDRVTLIGDAAHATTPHLGQGANQAIEDAVTLGVLLSTAQVGDLPRRLELYEQLRMDRTGKIQQCSRQLGRIYRAADLTPDQRAQRIDAITGTDWIYPYDATAIARNALATST